MTNWLTLEEAAQYLKMGKSTLYDFARKRNVPAHKMGREWRFDAEELDEWLKAGKSVWTSNASQNGCRDEK